jgi:transmembrane sensor
MGGETGQIPELDSEAITWVVRLTSGEADASDRAAFEAWRKQSPAHEAALIRARQLWLSLGDVLPAREVARAPEPAAKRRRLVPALALAASVLLCVGISFQYVKVWRHDYVTAAGQRESLTLDDGSHVLLSSGSAIDVRFEAGIRHVQLVRGEAYFDVVHDEKRPFIVAAGAGQVRDVGTAFSVRWRGDDVVVMVERGRVEVDGGNGAKPVALAPNQRISYSAAAIGTVEAANSFEDMAWTRGRLILEDRSLGAVVADLNRYYPSELLLLGGDVAQRRVNAVIDLDHIDDWLNALHESQHVSVTRLPGLVVLR